MDELKKNIVQGTVNSLKSIGINRLVDMIDKSQKEQREYGVNICSNTDIPPFGDIFLSETAIGEKNHVAFKDCKGTQIGSFHTHTDFNSELSSRDIYAELASKGNFSCVGTLDNKNKNKKTINCFINAYHVEDHLAVLDFYKKQGKFLKQLKEYGISTKTPSTHSKMLSGDIRHIDELLSKLTPDKKKIMYDLYKEGLEADFQLSLETEKISKKHKDADLNINIITTEQK